MGVKSNFFRSGEEDAKTGLIFKNSKCRKHKEENVRTPKRKAPPKFETAAIPEILFENPDRW